MHLLSRLPAALATAATRATAATPAATTATAAAAGTVPTALPCGARRPAAATRRGVFMSVRVVGMGAAQLGRRGLTYPGVCGTSDHPLACLPRAMVSDSQRVQLHSPSALEQPAAATC